MEYPFQSSSRVHSTHPRAIQIDTAATLRLSPSDISLATRLITRDSAIYHETGSLTLLPSSASRHALTALQAAFPSRFEAYHWDIPLTADRPTPAEWSKQRPEAKRERVRVARRFIAATAELEAGRPAWSAGYREDRAGRVRLQSCFLRIRGPEWDSRVEPLALPRLLMAGTEGSVVTRPEGEVCFSLSEMGEEVLVVEDVCYRTVVACVRVELLVKTRAPFKMMWKSRRWGKMSVFDQQEFHQALRHMQMEMAAGDSDMVFWVELI